MDKAKSYEEGVKHGVVLSIEALLNDMAEESNEQVPQALTDYIHSVTDIDVLKDFLVKTRRLQAISDMENFF